MGTQTARPVHGQALLGAAETKRQADGGADTERVASMLREIGRYLRVVDPASYRARAYERGAASIDAVADLERLITERRLAELPNVGAGIARVVEEICATGSARLLEQLRSEVPRGVVELVSVRGISVPRARRLHDELGIESVEDLVRACEEGRVRNLRGLGPKTEEKLLRAIDLHRQQGQRIPIANALDAARQVEAWMCEAYAEGAVSLAGGVRRWEEIVSSIDLVVATEDPEAAAARMQAFGPVARAQAEEGWTHLFRFAGGPPIRIACVPPARFGFELLMRTGSPGHVVELADRARALDVDLESANAPDEATLYGLLRLPWLPPEVREGDGEVELAASGDDFADLVTAADIRGAVHCHTTDSDGRLSVEGMARAAAELGLGYITITDHSAAAHYAGGLDGQRLRAQRKEIRQAQEALGDRMRILAGTECDILPNGDLDVPAGVLKELDVIIASIHARHGQDEHAMTARLVRCLSHPARKIWGHPLGRLLLLREPVPCRLDEVLAAAAASGTVIEVNGDPRRLDLPPGGLRAARRLGLSFVISADAHSARGLLATRYAVAMARRGWLRRGEVLNTRTAEEFAAAVHPLRRAA